MRETSLLAALACVTCPLVEKRISHAHVESHLPQQELSSPETHPRRIFPPLLLLPSPRVQSHRWQMPPLNSYLARSLLAFRRLLYPSTRTSTASGCRRDHVGIRCWTAVGGSGSALSNVSLAAWNNVRSNFQLRRSHFPTIFLAQSENVIDQGASWTSANYGKFASTFKLSLIMQM